MAHLVYFSSVSENTHRFVQKLARASEARGEGPCPAIRIPLRGDIEVDTPYVLIVPTYGGGQVVTAPFPAWPCPNLLCTSDLRICLSGRTQTR